MTSASLLRRCCSSKSASRQAAVAGLASNENDKRSVRVYEPINLAILIQDDLTSQVGNEIRVTADFIRALPSGSRVMIGYITTGTLQVRTPFTTDLDKAARSLRMPISSTAASPYNPYVEVIEAIRKFDRNERGRNVILLVSDGLDVSRGFDSTAAGNTIDLYEASTYKYLRTITLNADMTTDLYVLPARPKTVTSSGAPR